MPQELLRKRDIIERFHVAPRTLDNWIIQKSIPFVKFGKLIRFIPADVETFVEKHRIQPRAAR